MSTRIADLRPDFQQTAREFIDDLEAQGINHAIYCTGRTAAEQADAFKRGASKCDGIKILSPHQKGIAIDVGPLDDRGNWTWDYEKYADEYKAIATVARAHGLECGQDWAPLDPTTGMGWDPPHYQMV